VLNAGGAREPWIDPGCAKHFNRIVKETGAKAVISSSWRSLVHNRSMTLLGFEAMLRTHGVHCYIIGVTPPDGKVLGRGKQIAAWLTENGPTQSYVVLDDDEYEIRDYGPPTCQDGWYEGAIGAGCGPRD
jgi:hypothetical protein